MTTATGGMPLSTEWHPAGPQDSQGPRAGRTRPRRDAPGAAGGGDRGGDRMDDEGVGGRGRNTEGSGTGMEASAEVPVHPGPPVGGAMGPPDALPEAAREAIRRELLARNWTQAHFAQASGTTESQMAQVMGGRVGVKLGRLRKMAAAFGWSTARLLGEEPPASRPDPAPAREAAGQGNAQLRAPEGPPPTWPVYAWGTPADPTDPGAVEERRAAPPSDQTAKLGPRGFAVDVPGDAMAGWGLPRYPGIRPDDLAWVNPDRPAVPGATVAALVGHGTGLVVAEYAQGDGPDEYVLRFHRPGVPPDLAAGPGDFRVVGRVVYVDSGFTPL